MKVTSDSPSRTKELGRLLAKEILRGGSAEPIIIGLKGNLGAGKTTFIKGFAEGLGVRNKITSSTFVILRHYPLKQKKCAHFFHMDAYRIKKISELRHLGFGKIISLPKSVTLIEWPENIGGALPQKTKWLEFRHGRRENERVIAFKMKG